MKNIKKMFFVLTLATLLITVGAVCATDNTTTTDTVSESTISETSDVITTEVTKTSDNTIVNTKNEKKNINSNKNKELKKEPKTIILNNQTFNTYVTNKTFNDNVSDGDIIDAQGLFYGQDYSLTINKAVNFTSTTNDANFSTNKGHFSMSETSSGSNITNINIYNSQVVLSGITNVNINNITMTIETGGIGMGQGGFSVRNNAINVTLTNSYFKTNNNGGISTMVLGGASNFLFENNTIEAIGVVGNLFYLTTYNTPEGTDNGNTIIRNNYINGNKANVAAICYGIGLAGENILIENNVIEYGGQCVAPQWGQGSQNNITFINNTIPYGSAALGYSSSVAINNTITNVGSINEAYNNTFGTVSVENTEKFKGNTVENLTITGSNIEITNDNTITGTLTISGSNNTLYSLSTTNITISGSDNNITNSDFEYVLISGKNNRFSNNTVNSTGDYAINITGSSNIISNDTVYSINKLGEAAIYSTQTNTIENIYPECLSYTLTDDNYSQYFDENAYAIESVLPNYSTIILSGDFYDKSFNFKDNVYTIDGNDSVLYNSRFSFEDSNIYLNCTTINNTGKNVNNSISINGGVVKIIQVNIYDDSDNIEEIVVNGQGHEIMNCIINIDTQTDVTAIKVTQNGSNKIRNNQINITGKDVTAINITGQTINDELDYNKIFINSTNANAMIVTGDDLINNKLNNVNIAINASENARAIVLDDNKSLINTNLNQVIVNVIAENVSFIEANLQNNNCSSTAINAGTFNANGTNITGLTIYGNSTAIWNANFVINGSQIVKTLTISGDSCVVGRANPTIVGSNTEDDLLRSVFLTVENSNNFKFNGQCNINLYNATGNVFINGHNNDIGYEVINCYENSAEIILINETNTHITNGVNSQRPLIMINSSSNTINRMPFNRDSTIILNNSNYNIFESDTFNGNESTILEINSTGNIYRSNTFNNNIILTLTNSTFTNNNNKNITIEGSQNTQLLQNTITGTITVKDSDNINITNNTVTSTEEYAVVLTDTTNSLVKINHLYAQEKEGDHAVSNNNSTNTIKDNLPADEIILTDDNYSQYFDENSRFIPETPELIMRLGSDLHNKDLILPGEITFDGTSYTIYNGTITVTGNDTKIIENITINNTDDRTSSIIAENGYIQLTNNNIYQEGDNKIVIKLENNTSSKTTISNNIVNVIGDNNIIFQSNNFTGPSRNNITVTGDNNTVILYANATNIGYMEYNNIEVYANSPATEVLIDNAIAYFRYNNIIVNTTQEDKPIVKVTNNNQTQVTNNYLESSDLIGSLAVENEGKTSDNLPLASILLTDDNYDTYFEDSTYISNYEQITLGSDLHNKDLIINKKIIFEGANYTIYNGTITNDNENMTIQNTNIINGSITSTGGYITIYNTNINNTDNHTAMTLAGTIRIYNNTIYQETNDNTIIKMENGTILLLENNTIFAIGNNITLISANARSNKLNNNELTAIGDNNIAIHVLATLREITQNNITMNATTPVIAILFEASGSSINNNHIVTNTTQGDTKLIIANNFRNSWINDNYVEALDMMGDGAIESNGGVNNNIPLFTCILTDDNYDTYFTDSTFTGNHELIILGSDLYNKDLIFTKDIKVNGNGYTIYNGTINVTSTVTIENITINNTDERTSSIISTGTLSFKNNTIYQETNDANVINILGGNLNVFEDNKITVIGNNNNLTDINGRCNTIQNNELTSIGDNNIAIHITQYSYEIKYNNITMNATTPVIAIQYDRNGNSINNNHIIANTTQGDTKLVIATNFRGHWINDNYIESLDMFGNDAIQTDGNINNNWPTSTSAHESMINIELPETMIANKENTITVTPTDLLGRTITGQITITDGETTTTTTENTITYIPTSSGEKTLTITYTDPTGKYNTITTEITTKVLKTTLTIDPITATAGQTINLTARITIDNQTLKNINKGKITFKVNGKTLKDANGKVIYAKVINGVATIENYVVPDDWSKDGTTIQAVYSGSTQCDKLTSEKTELNITSPETTLTITPITDDVQTGSTITLKAKVAAGDKAITNGKIVFKINGKTVKDANGKVIYAHVDSNGEVSVDYNLGNLKAGSYTIEATFMAPGYDKITSNTTMTVVKA